MGCPALGVWVAFLKQPDALPGRAPPKRTMLDIPFKMKVPIDPNLTFSLLTLDFYFLYIQLHFVKWFV
jgi:hypothetical protein